MHWLPLATAVALAGIQPILAASHWPQFRGPEGDGHARHANPPTQWSESNGVRWKTPIHGKGWASPVVWKDQVWVATATEDGQQLSVLCVDATNGKVIRDLKLFEVSNPQFCHKFNSYASPTPVIEEGRIYVTFGSPGTAALDTATGRVLWERRDLECNHYRGSGSSPIVYGDLLIMHFDGSDAHYVVALNKNTGATVWRTERSVDFKDLGPDGKPASEGDFRKAYATPHIARLNDIPVLLSQGAKAFYAYNPANGEELWRVEERGNHSGSTRPVLGHGLVYIPTGFSTPFLLAIRPGAKGDVLDVNGTAPADQQLDIVWKSKRSIPKKPSLILHEDLLFGVEDGGVATCWNARTGETIWNERLAGNHSASPILANGRLYFCTEEGKTYVVAADRQFKILAENTLADGFMASPAVTGDALLLRTTRNLYRIEN